MKDEEFLFESTPGMHILYADCSRPAYPEFYPEIPYRKRDGRTLHIQLLTTAKSGEKHPLLVYIQGSAWLEQNRHRHLLKLTRFAMEGYVVASVEYRPSTLAQFPAQILDTRAAIAFLCEHAQEYAIDPQRIAIFGDSSGGHTAVMTALAQGALFEEEGVHVPPLRAVVDFYGPSALDRMSDFPSDMDHADIQSPECLLIGGKLNENHARVQAADPRSYISPDRRLPPILILHGDRDATVPFNQSLLLYEKLRDCGQNTEFYKVHGAGHGTGMWCTRVLDVVSAFLQAYV